MYVLQYIFWASEQKLFWIYGALQIKIIIIIFGLRQADSIVGRCIGPMQKYSQDLVVRHLPQCVETSGGEERVGSDDASSMPSVLNGGDS